MYFFTVFHKLNTDFLSPDVSCSAFFYQRQVAALSFLPDGELLRVGLIYATLLVETAIPLLLAIRVTRGAGILLGMAFHLLLSFNPISGFYNFSSMLIPLFLLFAPEDVPRRAHGAYRNAVAYIRSLQLRLPQAAMVSALAMLIALVGLSTYYDSGSRGVFLVLWTFYAVAILLGTLPCIGLVRSGRRGVGTTHTRL